MTFRASLSRARGSEALPGVASELGLDQEPAPEVLACAALWT